MRPSSNFVLLTALCVSISACASAGPNAGPDMSIAQTWSEGFNWVHPLGNCAHWEADVAIRECTRKLDGGLYPRRDRVQAYALRASAYVFDGDFDRALADYDEALRLAPENAELRNVRAWLLATAPEAHIRNDEQAIADALAALRKKPRNPVFLDTLAAAYAENGDFERAVEVQQSAIALVPLGDQAMMTEMQSHLALYSQDMPYRDVLAGFVPTVWSSAYRSYLSGRSRSVVVLPQRPVAAITEQDSSE